MLAAFESAHLTRYGTRPRATSAWSAGEAVLLIARTDADESEGRGLARAVCHGVALRGGAILRPAGAGAHARRGLLVLAFEHRQPAKPAPRSPREQLAGAG